MNSFRFISVVLFFLCQLTWADSRLCVSNNSPFHQFHFIPCLPSVAESDSYQLVLSSERSNIFYYDEESLLSNEQAVVDGEINRQRLQIEKQVSGFLLGAEITQVEFAAGNWDSTIEDWHGAFDFVNWEREDYPQNHLQYSYQSENVNLTIFERQSTIRNSYYLGYALDEYNQWLKAIRLGYAKSHHSQLMSPSSAWLSLQSSGYPLEGGHLLQASVGLSYSETNGVLAEIQNQWVYFGSVSYGYRFFNSVDLVMQMNGSSAHYKSESAILGKPSSQLSGAIFWQVSRGNELSFGLVEDIQIGASPDLTLQIGYKYRSN